MTKVNWNLESSLYFLETGIEQTPWKHVPNVHRLCSRWTELLCSDMGSDLIFTNDNIQNTGHGKHRSVFSRLESADKDAADVPVGNLFDKIGSSELSSNQAAPNPR